MPLIILFIVVFGLLRKGEVYQPFVTGASEGLKTLAEIIPSIVGILVAVEMLKSSGAVEMLAHALSPLLKLIGMPADIIPLAFLRPFSGSGSVSIVSEIIKTHGPDSYAGRIASVMMGSTETTFYTVALYYGVAKVKNIRHTLHAALLADLCGIIGSVIVCRLYFRM
ncbi:MAG: spore maturation protein [Clostridia bacterium]|nr:spore maturation protein [Clostridia bacterium]